MNKQISSLVSVTRTNSLLQLFSCWNFLVEKAFRSGFKSVLVLEFVSLGQLARKKDALKWTRVHIFHSISHFAFSKVSLISKCHLVVELYLFQGIPGIIVSWKNPLGPSVLNSPDLPIFIFSTFRDFSYYSIIGSWS